MLKMDKDGRVLNPPLPKRKEKYNVAIAGATGAVGVEFLNVLASRKFPIENLKLLASKKSMGKKIVFENKVYTVEELTEHSFKDCDIALFSAGGAPSKKFVPAAVAAGAVVIDNSSAFRMDPKVPLVIPEVNPEAVFKHQGVIANPNCTTIIMLTAIFPIHQINPIKKIVVSSYQAVSGAGAKALAELKTQQKDLVAGKRPVANIFRHVIVNNVFSHDSDVLENGYNQEEMKMVHETHKILGNDTIQICPTCVRVPIERAHSEAIHLELANPVNLADVKNSISKAKGVKIADDRVKNYFPMPLDVMGQYDVLVGRLREDLHNKNAMNLFVCGDQLLKGAALNAVQIAEVLIKN